jgi:hypothetical protein
MKNIFKISTLSIITILALSSCGGGSSTSATTNTKQGYFIDSGVEGLDYKATPSGKTGITDKDGLFDYVDGDTVKFSVGNFELGEAKPTQDGLVTPEAIIPEDMTEEARTEAEGLMLRVLQSIDIDNDASNGIEIPEDIRDLFNKPEFEPVVFSELDEESLLDVSPEMKDLIDTDNDGIIDVDLDKAILHHEESKIEWENNQKPSTLLDPTDPSTETSDLDTTEVPSIETPDSDTIDVPSIETPNSDTIEVPSIETPESDTTEKPTIETPDLATPDAMPKLDTTKPSVDTPAKEDTSSNEVTLTPTYEWNTPTKETSSDENLKQDKPSIETPTEETSSDENLKKDETSIETPNTDVTTVVSNERVTPQPADASTETVNDDTTATTEEPETEEDTSSATEEDTTASDDTTTTEPETEEETDNKSGI